MDFYKKLGLREDSRNTQVEVIGRSLLQSAFIRFRKNKAAQISIAILGFIVLFVLFAPLISQYDFDEVDFQLPSSPPNENNGHWFGTDALGRDLFVRTAQGGRLSLLVGFAGAVVAACIGTFYGALSGYLGGKWDYVMMRILEVLNAFPFMFFVILLVTFFGRNILLIFVAIGMVAWLDVARVVRGQTLSLKHKEFIEAAITSGSNTRQIICKHIFPNVLGIVIVYTSLLVPNMILFESFLSFLGLGVQEPNTSWGALLEDGVKAMEVNTLQLFIPACFLVITLFCLNFIGDGLRDAFDPKDR